MEEETDELLLADDELFDVDPEALPRRVMSDFSIYNSEVCVQLQIVLPGPEQESGQNMLGCLLAAVFPK